VVVVVYTLELEGVECVVVVVDVELMVPLAVRLLFLAWSSRGDSAEPNSNSGECVEKENVLLRLVEEDDDEEDDKEEEEER